MSHIEVKFGVAPFRATFERISYSYNNIKLNYGLIIIFIY